MTEAPGSTTPNKWPEPVAKPDGFPCPDCDRVFDKPQGLGAHRSRSHGYRTNKAKKTYTTPTIVPKPINAAIEAIFPNGIPVDREVLMAVVNFMEAHDRLVELGNQ